MASRLRSILSPPKSLSPVALSDAPKENQRPRTTLPTPPQTPGLNRAFVQGVASPEALLSSSRGQVQASEVLDETIRERLVELEEAYELAAHYTRGGERRVKLVQDELAEQQVVNDNLRAEIERRAKQEFQLKQRVQQLEQDYELAIHYVRATEQSMKRMKSELKRHQASSATEVSETPSTRSSFDVDISLAQNEILANPSPSSEHITLVISAAVEDRDIPIVPPSAQTVQNQRDAVTEDPSTSAQSSLDGQAARGRKASFDSERALHTSTLDEVRKRPSDDPASFRPEPEVPIRVPGDRPQWPKPVIKPTSQNVFAFRKSFHVPWLGKTSDAGPDFSAVLAIPAAPPLVKDQSPRLSSESTAQQQSTRDTSVITTNRAPRPPPINFAPRLALRSCSEPLPAPAWIPPSPRTPRGPRAYSLPSPGTAGVFSQTRSRRSLPVPVPQVAALEMSSSQGRDCRLSSTPLALCESPSLSIRPPSSLVTAGDSTAVSLSQRSARTSFSAYFLPPTPTGPSPATQQEMEEALEILSIWKPTPDDTLIAQVWIHWIDSNLQTVSIRDLLYIPLLHHLRMLCRFAQRLPPSYRLDPSEVRLRDHDPIFTSAHSDVFQAERHGQLVALKTIRVNGESREDVRRAFHSEAVMWKFLRHPNIVPFIGVSPMFPICLVSEWMPNGDISQYLKAHESADRVSFLNEVIDGLQHMHSLDIVHGDLKASNILVDAAGHARLTDFGLSTVLFGNGTFTGSGSPRGTIPFMAPEILEGSCAVTVMSDVYALGMVVYELFSGTVPFADQRNEIALIMPIILGKRPERPTVGEQLGLTDALWAMTICCWHADALQRPTLEEVKFVCRSGPVEIPSPMAPLDGINWEDEFEDDVDDAPTPALTHDILQLLSSPHVLRLMRTAADAIRDRDRRAIRKLLLFSYGDLI